MNLSADSIEWTISHLEKVGDSDLFPRPLEFDAVLALKNHTKDILTKANLSQILPSAARKFFVPKDNLSIRNATQFNLIDSIILTTVIHQYGHLIEQRRQPVLENRVFSYRFKPETDGWLYDKNFDWTPFWENCFIKSDYYSHVLIADISDFYNQIAHHILENQLIESGLPNQVTKWILELFGSLTAKVSRGIPVGPHAAHLLAEASLIPVDNSLVLKKIEYIRFVDDFVIFAKSENEARSSLYKLAEILDAQQRLVLNKQKTKILSREQFKLYCQNMIEDRPINDLEDQLLKIVNKYSRGNPYCPVLISQISLDDLKFFNQEVLEVILNEYLAQEAIDFVRLRWFLRRLTQIGHPGAIDFCVKHLDSLIPALSDVCHYLVSASLKYEGDCANLGDELLKCLSKEIIQSTEYFQICVLSLFSRNPKFNHFNQLIELYGSSSENVRREIILSAGTCNGADWLRELKESFLSMNVWCKQAFLFSAKTLPPEERKFFAKNVREDSPLDQILLKWVRER
ncbi:RNA-directed DNA polymerase [Laspinema sp. D1]|uniref:RNA-directed DNA polymerase n=1 Tax=Laspinema palackyanum TaxID=3231601 RepID=UPI003475772E|nr:RNA-directed DNA polymerase [Laspinema sp. D2b]